MSQQLNQVDAKMRKGVEGPRARLNHFPSLPHTHRRMNRRRLIYEIFFRLRLNRLRPRDQRTFLERQQRGRGRRREHDIADEAESRWIADDSVDSRSRRGRGGEKFPYLHFQLSRDSPELGSEHCCATLWWKENSSWPGDTFGSSQTRSRVWLPARPPVSPPTQPATSR
jgi:hypothetical protein